MRQIATREEWLRACLTRVTVGWPVGSDLPENTRISLGFPQKRTRSPAKLTEHYRPADSEGGLYEIFVSPTVAGAFEVARAVALEAARVATGREPGGREADALADRARAVIRGLPPYPHKALKVTAPNMRPVGAARPGSRLIKVLCRTEGCGYTARITRRWLARAVPECPIDHGHGVMYVEGSPYV